MRIIDRDNLRIIDEEKVFYCTQLRNLSNRYVIHPFKVRLLKQNVKELED